MAGPACAGEFLKVVVEPGVTRIEHKADIAAFQFGQEIRLPEVEALPRPHILDRDPESCSRWMERWRQARSSASREMPCMFATGNSQGAPREVVAWMLSQIPASRR